MSNVAYAQAVSRLRAIETKLLDRAKLDRMIDSSTTVESFKILGETEYGAHMVKAKKPEDYEIVLSEELKSLYSLMYNVSPEKKIIDLMSVRYDYHNIKVLIKGNALGKDLSYLFIPVGTIDTNVLKNIIELKDYYDLNPIMREAVEKVEESYEKEKDPQKIDIILDSYMYKNMLSIATELNIDYLLKFVKVSVDLSNLKTLLRIKKQKKDREFLQQALLEGGTIDIDTLVQLLNESNENIISKLDYTNYSEVLKNGIDEFSKTGRLNKFEMLSDNFIMNFIKDAKYVSFGAEPLLAYIYAKENEIKIVRIIMVGKLNNIAADVIRERLRDIYV
jgi:V/A-type H+-transporting ATPase subunit C